MKAYHARLCWNTSGKNTSGWIRPTGEARDLEIKSSYCSQFGFGHEEWLFNPEFNLNGYQYGYIQAISRTKLVEPYEKFILYLHTIGPEKYNSRKRRYSVGYIKSIVKIDRDEATNVASFFNDKKLFDLMKTDLKIIDGNIEKIDQWKTDATTVINCKFRLSDLSLNDPIIPLGLDHPTQGMDYYHMYRPANNSHKFFHRKTKGSPNPKSIIKGKVYRRNLDNKVFRRSTLHDEIQNKLQSYLQTIYPKNDVLLEERDVDVYVKNKDRYLFIEVKNESTARQAIRLALGQLLEYTFYGQKNISSIPELFVAGPAGLNKADIEYLDKLNDQYRLSIKYIEVSLDKDIEGL